MAFTCASALHISARLAPLAATLLTSLAQNYPYRQSSSAHHSCCCLIQLFRHAQLTLPGQNLRRRQVSAAHQSRCSLIHRFRHTHFARAESHMQTGVICPSLALLAHSALLEDSARFARTVPPGGRSGRNLVARVPMTYLTIHQSISQIGPQTAEIYISLFGLQERHLVADQGATWWQGYP